MERINKSVRIFMGIKIKEYRKRIPWFYNPASGTLHVSLMSFFYCVRFSFLLTCATIINEQTFL